MVKKITIEDLRREIEEEAEAEEAKNVKADEATPSEIGEPGLVPRSTTFRVEYRDPDTGRRLVASVTVAVPRKEERNLLGRYVEKFLNMPWLRASVPEQVRAYRLAECAIAFTDAPDWFWSAIQEDDEFLEEVHGGWVTHATMFRAGNDQAGRAGKVPPRFSMVPAIPAGSEPER